MEFENGVLLVKHCQKILETTEQKVKGLLDGNLDSFIEVYLKSLI